MNLAVEIYNALITHCGESKNVRGVTEQALRHMKNGIHAPNLSTISKIFKANDMPAEIVIHVKDEGKKSKLTIKL